MSAAQKAIETSPLEDAGVLARPADAAAPQPVTSPALTLQATIATAYGSGEAETWPEPEVQKWPGWARLAFLLVAAAGSWLLVAGLVALFLRL